MNIEVHVFYFIMGLSFLTGVITQTLLLESRIENMKRHRETELKDADAEIKRLRAQVALHVGTK